MADIRHRVGVRAPIDEVYAAITTADGIARWWTTTTDADPAGTIGVRFGGPRAATIELADATPPSAVTWRFPHAPDEWLVTSARFELKANGDETVVLFTHADWAEPVEFMHHCSTRWGYFLHSLKGALERGQGTPWPDDEKASTWG